MEPQKMLRQAIHLAPAVLIGLILTAGLIGLAGSQVHPAQGAAPDSARHRANTAVTQPVTLTGVTLEGPSSGLVGTNLVFTATVHPLTVTGAVTYRWEGSGLSPVTHTNGVTDVALLSWPTNGPQTLTVYAMNGQPPVSATLPVMVEPRSTFLPFISTPTTDLTVAGVEIVQTVQTSANNVPLVTGRPAVVRVYAQSNRPISGFPVTIAIAGTRGGVPLPGSPLRVSTASIPEVIDPGELDDSINVALPFDWLFGTISLAVTVDEDNVIYEFNESNNSTALSATFNDVPALEVMIVPINYTHAPTGQYFPGPTQDTIGDWLIRSFPVHAVNVNVRTPLAFTGDMSDGSEWNRLLNTVTSLKSADGAPSAQVYYGLLPSSNNAGESYPRAWAGIGWIGLRASIGVNYSSMDSTGRVAAHEIGHNFGRRHAPCGGPSGVDPSYPYANASIGHYGLDTFRMDVWDPASAKDLMSYCSPKWLSDYTYIALYNNQRAYGAMAAGTGADLGLLFRAVLPAGGDAEILPFYALTDILVTRPLREDLTAELLGPDGQVLAAHPVTLMEGPYESNPYQAVNAVLPHPGGALTAVRLTRGDQVLATRRLEALPALLPNQPGLTRGPAGALQLEWGSPGSLALIRFKPTGASTWTTLGLDLTGGALRLTPGSLPSPEGTLEISLADSGQPALWQLAVNGE